jgi:hypothetical protein
VKRTSKWQFHFDFERHHPWLNARPTFGCAATQRGKTLSLWPAWSVSGLGNAFNTLGMESIFTVLTIVPSAWITHSEFNLTLSILFLESVLLMISIRV